MDVHYLDYKEGATTVRPPAFAELLVDSTDRYGRGNSKNGANDELALLKREINNDISSSDFLYQKNQAQLSGYFTRIAITDLEIDWRTPNINERNNLLCASVYWNGGQKDFGLPLGNYNSSTKKFSAFYDGLALASNMQDSFDTFWGAGLISTIWNPVESSLTVDTISTGVKIAFNTNESFSTFLQSSISTPVLTQQLAPAYRFLQTINATGNFLTSTTSATTRPTNLAYTNYVDIVSNELTKYARVKDNMTRQTNPQQSVVARVYMNAYNTNNPMSNSQATEPHTIATDFTTPKYIRWNPSEYLNNFDLSLYDEYGDKLYWDSEYSTEYRLTIQASES